MGAGRPSKYKPEYAKQAAKLCRLGANVAELIVFFEGNPSEDDWLRKCYQLICEDRRGVFAAQKRKRAARRQNWIDANPSIRVRNAISARMWASLKGKTDGALFSKLGYTIEDLVFHLEKRFTDGMSWGNYGDWHVDHIKPCASFDLTIKDQFDECWALHNLQPLWAIDNHKKGARYGAS